MSKKKSLLALLMLATVLAACLLLSSCSKKITSTLNVAALNGPTGMGMVQLMDNDKIKVTTYQAADEAAQKLISGDADIAALPSNMAAVLYNKTGGDVVALSTICSGVLYIVENGNAVNSIADLKGKTIVASGKGGTPEYVLEILLAKAGLAIGTDVQVQWMDVHSDVAQTVFADAGTVALLPEPFVSMVKTKWESVHVAVDLNEAWEDAFGEDLPMGVLVAKKSVVDKRGDDVKAFLSLYKQSAEAVDEATDEIAEKIVKAGFLPAASIAKAVIPHCNIECEDPEDTKEGLSKFFKLLYEAEPKSVGGKLPGDDLYYSGK